MSQIISHPSTLLRKEIEELKTRIDKLEKSLNVSEQVVIELVHKHNSLIDQIVKLSNTSQPETLKRKKNIKDK
jgi:sugar-specific transcriptional regulator TrmB